MDDGECPGGCGYVPAQCHCLKSNFKTPTESAPDPAEAARLQERVQLYAMLGLVSYIEERAKAFEVERKRPPRACIVGKLEWLAILECQPKDDFPIAGLDVIFDDTLTDGVRFT